MMLIVRLALHSCELHFLVMLLLFMLIKRLIYRYVMYLCLKLDNEVKTSPKARSKIPHIKNGFQLPVIGFNNN
jgi:hypothetical protein